MIGRLLLYVTLIAGLCFVAGLIAVFCRVDGRLRLRRLLFPVSADPASHVREQVNAQGWRALLQLDLALLIVGAGTIILIVVAGIVVTAVKLAIR